MELVDAFRYADFAFAPVAYMLIVLFVAHIYVWRQGREICYLELPMLMLIEREVGIWILERKRSVDEQVQYMCSYLQSSVRDVQSSS